MFGHGTDGARVGGQFDNGHDRVADDVALPGGEEVHHVAGGGHEGDHFGSGGGGVHEPQAGAGRRHSLVQRADDGRLRADLLDVAEGLFFDGGQAAFDVALGRLGVGKVGGLVIVNHLGVTVKERGEFAADPVIGATGLHQMFAAGEFGGFTEHQRAAFFIQLVERVTDGRAGGQAGGGVGFAAFAGNPQVGDGAFHFLEGGGVLHEFLRLAGSAGDGVDLAVLFDAEAGNGLAGLGNAVHHVLGPLFFDADNDDGGNVRVAAGADQGAEVEVKVGTELQTAVRMLDGNGAADVIGNGVASGLGKVVQGQNQHMIANAHAAVVAAITEK